MGIDSGRRMMGEKKEKGVTTFFKGLLRPNKWWHALDYILGTKYKADRNCLGVR